MASYTRPPDPRDPKADLAQTRPMRPRGKEGEQVRPAIPWLWLGLGVLVTLAGIALALALAAVMLVREPLAVTLPTPSVIRLTAPPSRVPSPTPAPSTPTPIPTLTPLPTPDLSIAPPAVSVGYYAQVVNTQGIGVSVRAAAGTDSIRLFLAPEGMVMLVIGGPAEGGSFTWWQVRLANGTEGWIAGDFLVPTARPDE
jgi:hypothetical protein